MTDYRWDETRAKAIRQLGETPAAPTENDIIEAFKENPRHVVAVIDAVTAERNSGAVLRSAWAVIRYRTTTSPTEEVIATDGHEKQLRIRQAEAWTRNAGLYCANESEALSELFDEGRPLYPWQDQGLETRMTELWHTNRPRGEAAEADQERRALERVELRQRLKEAQCSRTTPAGSTEPTPRSSATSGCPAPNADSTSAATSGSTVTTPAGTATAASQHAPAVQSPATPSSKTHPSDDQSRSKPTEPLEPEYDDDPNWHHTPEPELEVEA